MTVRRASYLVYKYETEDPVIRQPVYNVNCTFLTQSRVLRFFAGDKDRKLHRFIRFIHRGFIGLVLHKDNEWVAYAWMATPRSPQPLHLPRWIRRLGAYWVFYCGTKEKYRNQGYYKLALSLLVQHASDLGPPSIYVDTTPSNTASRRAITAVGFHPRGVIECISLRIPGLCHMAAFSKWDQGAQHPELI